MIFIGGVIIAGAFLFLNQRNDSDLNRSLSQAKGYFSDATCPESSEAWEKFRRDVVVHSEFSTYDYALELIQFIESCDSEQLQAECFKNLVSYADHFARHPVSTRKRNKKLPRRTVDEIAKITNIEDFLSHESTLKILEEMSKAKQNSIGNLGLSSVSINKGLVQAYPKEWLVFKYHRSGHLFAYLKEGGRVPGWERWVQFQPKHRRILVMAVLPKGDPPESVFSEVILSDIGGAGRFMDTSSRPTEPLLSCLICHNQGAPIKIHWQDSYKEFYSQNEYFIDRIHAANRVLEQYPPLVSGNNPYARQFAPPLGKNSPERRKSVLEDCLQDHPDHRFQVEPAMNCTGCHDGKDQRFLLPPFDLSKEMTMDGRMPYGENLTAEESKSLWKCLQQDYFKSALPAWIESAGNCQ